MTLDEKRHQKYPDTKYFHYHNQNPRKRITGDCVFRAISKATGKPYNECVTEMAALMCVTGYALDDTYGIEAYMKQLGWVKMRQPKKYDGRKYTGEEFCSELLRYDSRIGSDVDFDFDIRHIVANIGGHHTVAIVEGQVNDTWNSTGGCIGNFWVRKIS